MMFLRRILYWCFRLFTGARYHAQRRFTRPGLALLGGLVVAGISSADISGSVAYQAFLLLSCLLGVSLACACWGFRARFTAQRLLPRFGTVGVPLSYRISLRNQTRFVQQGLVLLENVADPRPDFAEFVALQQAEEQRMRSFSFRRHGQAWVFAKAKIKESPLPPLEPGREMEAQMELIPLKRGLIRFSALTVARTDPLGLFRACTRIPLSQSLLVLPRRYPLPPIALPGLRKYQPGGVALATSVGESEEFVALRDYRQGDPLRRIHWRSWARLGRPIVKEYQDEFFVRHALILDTFVPHPQSQLFEEAVSVAASFACAVHTQESLLDLLFVGPEAYCFTSGRGLAHTDQMLEILAAVRVCREKPFADLEALVINHISAVSGCICVLLAWDEPRQQLIRKLKMLGVPMMVLIIQEPGGEVLDPGPMREEPQYFHTLSVGAIAEGLARMEMRDLELV
ncbi:MAG: DUF58 domain-containing protein [Verrucomicrobia bacterium]|nr:DUF58 domain-containing protein [Verrucomicrobiota bacterium]